MLPSFTIDANILIYSIDNRDEYKHNISLKVIQLAKNSHSILTLQSLSEFYNVVAKRSYIPLDDAEMMVSEMISTFNIVGSSTSSLNHAVKLHLTSKNNIQFWDAMLLATAKEHGANLMITEDFIDGSIIGGIEIYNPFNKQNLDFKLSIY